MLKNRDELEVYISHGVTEPDQAPLQLEYFPNRTDNRVGGEHLNPINENPFTPKFPPNPPDKPPPSNIPSKYFDPTVDEDPSNDDLEDDSYSKGNTSLDSDVGTDVHQEYIDIRASKRNFNRSQRRSRGTTTEQVNVGEKGPDIGYDESNIGIRDSLVGKLGGDEPYYPSDEAPSFELDDEVGWGDGEDGDEVVQQLVRRKNKKNRVVFYETYEKNIWELGLVFPSVKDFRLAVTIYAIQEKIQIEKYVNDLLELE
ncbi:hypothetical protein P3S68_014907 [Capsicum galapagoense]